MLPSGIASPDTEPNIKGRIEDEPPEHGEQDGDCPEHSTVVFCVASI